MRFIPFILILLIAAIGCGEADPRSAQERYGPGSSKQAGNGNEADGSEYNGADNHGAATASPKSNKNTTNQTNNNWQKLEMVALKDSKGQVIAQAPYPSTWNLKRGVKQGEPSITGPNGIKVVDQPATTYVYPYDAYTQQLYYQSGQQMRPFPGVESLVMGDFVPELQRQGWTFVKWYEVPEVAKIDKWYNDQLYQATPTKTDVMAIGTEWKNSDGSPAFIITHLMVSNSEFMQTWYYFSSVLKADKAHFENARKQYIFSMANTRYALEPIMQYNQMEAQKIGQSWAAHNKRMAQNQAAFEQQQRDFVNRSNSINEGIMSGWNDRNASSDRQHQKTIDGIWEQENATNTSTGQQYKTSIHYNNYWMNSSGQYLSTNQNDYNPNLDENLNNQNWDRLQKND